MVEAPVRKGERNARSAVVSGIGDDAGVWRPSRSHLSVITSDAMVDGVHFESTLMRAEAIGHRALAANLSDVAAMGGRPLLATVVLGLAPGTRRDWIVDCYRGMAGLAGRHGTRIVGGDIVRAPAIWLGITLVGEVARRRLKRRSGGRPGDILALTGLLGLSRAGLELLRRPELEVAPETRRAAVDAFATPAPRVREGRWLAASAHVHAMIDLSDGLSLDLARLATASRCGATLQRIPVHPAAAAVAARSAEPEGRDAGGDPWGAQQYATEGGEDFELLIAVEPRAFGHLSLRFSARFGRPLIAVGKLDVDAGLRQATVDGTRTLTVAGYDHVAGVVV